MMIREIFVGIVIVVVAVSWYTPAIRATIKKWRGGEKEEASGIVFFFVLLPLGGAVWYWLH